MQDWNPFVESVAPESVTLFGVELRKGARVRLWPGGNADIFDIALRGRVATIEAIEQTLEGEIQVAVTVDDDPGNDLGALRQIGHRFFFRLEEIQPIDTGEPTL
jgi:hypothetical protein